MAIKVEINYDRRDKEVKLYANDEKITALAYLEGKSISDWFKPVESGRVQWKGLPLELKGILGTDDFSFSFFSDEESKKIFFDCLEEHGIEVISSTDSNKEGNQENILHETKNNSAEKYFETAMSYQEKDPKEALKYFMMAAEQGNVQALHHIALQHYHGLGTEENPREAFFFFEKGAQKGYAPAQYSCACCYDSADGVLENKDLAFYWYKKSAEQGNADGQYGLGDCFLGGRGVEKDKEAAYHWFSKSAEQNNPKGQCVLGVCYAMGISVEVNEEIAFDWYLKSAKQGEREGQYLVGDCYYYGIGVEKDDEQAFSWYEQSASQGSVDATFMLGRFYEEGIIVEEDKEKAFILFQESAEQGYKEAQCSLANLYLNGEGVEENPAQAFYWHEKSASQGLAVSQYCLGAFYEGGVGVEPDNEKAFHWYKEAAEQGDDDAQFSLGLCYASGEGVEQNQSLANQWIDLARQQGNVEAALYFPEKNAILCGSFLQLMFHSFESNFKKYTKRMKSTDADDFFDLTVELFGEFIFTAYGEEEEKALYLVEQRFSMKSSWEKVKTYLQELKWEISDIKDLEELLLKTEECYLKYSQKAFLGETDAQFEIALFHFEHIDTKELANFEVLAESGYAPAQYKYAIELLKSLDDTNKVAKDVRLGSGLFATALAVPLINTITIPAAIGLMGLKKAKDYLDKESLQRKAMDFLRKSAEEEYAPAVEKLKELEKLDESE